MLAVPAGLGDLLASWVSEHEAAGICHLSHTASVASAPPCQGSSLQENWWQTQTINLFPFF